MAFFGLTGSRRELRPNRRHAFVVLIIIFSILVPPLAVFLRFGIGVDFFLNILLTIAGYFPGHIHNFFVQRVRDNSLRPDRTPAWLRKAGLVEQQRGVAKDRKWADRYINPSRPVQYDEDGLPHYLDEDDIEETGRDPDALVEPDQYFQRDRQRRICTPKQRVDHESEEFFPSTSASTPMDSSSVPPRASKSFAARTKRFFGMHGGTSSASDTYPEHMNRHSRISNAMGDMESTSSRRAHNDFPEDDLMARSSNGWPSSSDASNYDDLDRELMGLSTQDNYPPVRGSRRPPRSHGPSMPPTQPSAAPPRDTEPQRDVLDFEHTF